MRIIIIEDDALLAFRMDDVLSSAGHSVVGFGWDEQSALQIAAITEPHLALVDLQLVKDTSGASVARQLDDRFGIPAIFVSGSPERCRALAQEAGVLGCLAKPFSDDELIAAVAAVENFIQGYAAATSQLPPNFEFYPLET